METTLKTLSWINIILGALALIGSLESSDFYALLGGLLFVATGWLTLAFIKSVKK